MDTIQDMTRVVGDTWRSLTMLEREPYEMVAQQEVHRHLRDKRIYEDLQRRYAELRFAAEQDGAQTLYWIQGYAMTIKLLFEQRVCWEQGFILLQPHRLYVQRCCLRIAQEGSL